MNGSYSYSLWFNRNRFDSHVFDSPRMEMVEPVQRVIDMDMYIVNRVISDISIEFPNNFFYPFLAIISLGMLSWLGRLDVLAMRAYLR